MATDGHFSWPSVGSSVAAYGQFFMAANTLAVTSVNAPIDAFQHLPTVGEFGRSPRPGVGGTCLRIYARDLPRMKWKIRTTTAITKSR